MSGTYTRVRNVDDGERVEERPEGRNEREVKEDEPEKDRDERREGLVHRLPLPLVAQRVAWRQIEPGERRRHAVADVGHRRGATVAENVHRLRQVLPRVEGRHDHGTHLPERRERDGSSRGEDREPSWSFAREVAASGTWAAGRAAFAGRRVRVVAVEFMSVLLHDEAAAKHAHAAGELVRSGARRRELDAGPLVRREEATDPEPRDHHFLGATRILPAIEH